ncbi:anillin-like isoform X3 [Protopterus annectens]|uniref:anillin-like isoform X3 n=1 Tax=Protopterus annectens TaxID=7888 RepID=UPI001CFAB0FD|nr:anillin-like isoform X3 [Protopterus annectens]
MESSVLGALSLKKAEQDRGDMSLQQPSKRPRGCQVDAGKDLTAGDKGHKFSDESTKRCVAYIEDIENVNPLHTSKGTPLTVLSQFRAQEQEIKPDTPVISSVKTRIKKLNEQKREWGLEEMECETFSASAHTSSTPRESEIGSHPGRLCNRKGHLSDIHTWEEDELNLALKMSEEHGGQKDDESGAVFAMPRIDGFSVSMEETVDQSEDNSYDSQAEIKVDVSAGRSVTSVIDEFEKLHESSTSLCSVTCASMKQVNKNVTDRFLNELQTPPSLSKISRIRKEREEELKLLRENTERSNPWVENDKINRKRKRDLLQEDSEFGDSVQNSSITSLQSQEGSESICVNSLNVRLQSASAASPSCTDGKETPGMNSSEVIDQIFNGVLDTTSGDEKDCIVEKEAVLDDEKDMFSLPPVSTLSPLAKSVVLDAVAPLNTEESQKQPAHCQQGDATSPPVPSTVEDYAPLYSIDAYRTQWRSNRHCVPCIMDIAHCTKEGIEESLESPNLDPREKIQMLNNEINSLQTTIQQTSQALNCCIDEEHGKGSLEEAEAERLLLIFSEKRLALLSELSKTKAENIATKENTSLNTNDKLEPCRGTVTISDIRLPLKVEYVCSATLKQPGKPSHYFLVMIRYGTHNIVATPIATALDAQKGDSIAFPTTVTLQDIRSSFEIDVEVYSLAQNLNVVTSEKKRPSKAKVITPKKLLSSITKSNMNSPASSPVVGNSTRTSSFTLVGSHKITMDSLGKNKFPLDKMKFERKARQLLGDEFQDKVAFISPVEGNIYLKLQCQPHLAVEHQGFLTIFEDVSGFGAWHRRWFVLSKSCISYSVYFNGEDDKPVGRINLANCISKKIEPVNRELCARPNTFELITVRPQQEDDTETLVSHCKDALCYTKTCLSADTKEERNQWLTKLNQVLLDLTAWGLARDEKRFVSSSCLE